MQTVRAVRWFTRRQGGCADAAADCAFDSSDFDPALKTRLLVLQPTPFCNLDCDYCYLPDRQSVARMSLDTVRLAAQRLLDDELAGPSIGVVWHAGEPLVMPARFYDEAIAIVDDMLGSASDVSHSIQTNATLIDDAWCELFKRHRIRVGVSVDGPAALHDAHRRTRHGKGTHHRVLRGIERLRRHGIAFHAIAVVTQDTLACSDAFYDFFAQLQVQEVGCNFDEAEGVHGASSLAGSEAVHAAFVARLLERSLAGGGRVRIRELANAFSLIADEPPVYRWRGQTWPDNAQVMPFALISVAHNGNFSTFSPELLGQRSHEFGDFVLGNVGRSGYLASTQSERFRRLWSAVARGTSACRASCAHFGYCGGGAPANKLYENGDLASAETLYCRTMLKRPFDAVLQRLEKDQRYGPPLVHVASESALSGVLQ
jgi:uncharacterized protein